MDDGEIIDLQKYREVKEEKEIEEIKQDVDQLIVEINGMIDEMESDVGPFLWRRELIDSAPILRKFMNMIAEGKRSE